MINQLRKIFTNLHIKNYRIVNHLIDQDLFILESGQSQTSCRKRVSKLTVFFLKDGLMYRLDVHGNYSADYLESTILNLIVNRQYYCRYNGHRCLGDSIDISAKSLLNSAEITDILKSRKTETSHFLPNELLNACHLYAISRISVDSTLCYTLAYSPHNMVTSQTKVLRGIATAHISDDPVPREIPFSGSTMNELVQSLSTEFQEVHKKATNGISNGAPDTFLGTCVISAKLIKLFFSFLCTSLVGQQILLGTSFFKADMFKSQIFQSKISLFRRPEKNLHIDAEGSLQNPKQYILDGVLLEAFNDVLSASVLEQRAGDMEMDFNRLSYAVSFANLCVRAPQKVASHVPIFTELHGNYVFFNQLTGELAFSAIGTDSLGNSKLLNYTGNIVDLINKISGSCSEPVTIEGMEVTDMILEF